MASRPTPIDKHLIADSFSKAAKNYDDYAFVQREIGDRLMERLALMKLAPKNILDIGCGTGWYTRALKKQFKSAKVFGVDLAPGMIAQARQNSSWLKKCHYEVGDMNQLPFSDNSIDLIFSNLTVQWSGDFAHTARELARVLKPQGLLLFSTLGPDTLLELKEVFAAIDAFTHVNAFSDMHDIGDALQAAKLFQPVMDRQTIVFEYDTVKGLMQDIKGVGAHNLNPNRRQQLMSKGQWQRVQELYQTIKERRGCNGFPATYEALFGHAWGTDLMMSSADDVQTINVIHPTKVDS